jgi:hypothetical protein
MISFRCSFQWDEDECDDWDGFITQITCLGDHYEVSIVSRSTLRVIIGRYSAGLFACIPEYQAACNLSTLDDTFYNSEKLIRAMESPVDGTTVACALRTLSKLIEF